MRKLRTISSYVIILFIVETLLQIIFYSIRVKYFDKYSLYEKFNKILFDAFYVIGSVKVVFFLPLYLIFYFFIFRRKNSFSSVKKSVYHSVLFLLIYFLLSFLLPGNFANRFIDTIVLTIIAFVTSFFLQEKIYKTTVDNQQTTN